MSDIQSYEEWFKNTPEAQIIKQLLESQEKDHLKAIEELMIQLNENEQIDEARLKEIEELKAENERIKENLKQLIPGFLYRYDDDGLFIGYHGDTEVSMEWRSYVEEVMESIKRPQPPTSEDL